MTCRPNTNISETTSREKYFQVIRLLLRERILPVDDLPNTTSLSHGYNVYMPGGQERSGREVNLSLSPYGQPG